MVKKRQFYSLGFLFSSDLTKVLLIEKKKPEWQKGLLNGIGGKTEEEKESSMESVIREFKEETGIDTEGLGWRQYAWLQGNSEGWGVACFVGAGDMIENFQTLTDEKVSIVKVSDILNLNTLSNIPWLVYLALDVLTGEETAPYHMEALYF